MIFLFYGMLFYAAHELVVMSVELWRYIGSERDSFRLNDRRIARRQAYRLAREMK